MSAPQTSVAAGGEPAATEPHDDWLTAEMNRQHRAGIPNLDTVSDGSVDYDGPRCISEDCRTAVDNDDELCEECADQPHAFVPEQGDHWPNFCVCGRIRSIGGYSPVHVDDHGGDR